MSTAQIVESQLNEIKNLIEKKLPTGFIISRAKEVKQRVVNGQYRGATLIFSNSYPHIELNTLTCTIIGIYDGGLIKVYYNDVDDKLFDTLERMASVECA